MKDRHIRRTYGGRPVPRRPLFPGLINPRVVEKKGGAARLGAQILAVVALLIVGTVAIVATTAYTTYQQIAQSLTPRLDALSSHQTFQTSRIYDRNGVLLYEFFDAGKRTKVPLDEISPLVISATIAIEDKTFFSNPGVDFEGIIKAVIRAISAGEERGGASTITQQVIKNIILTEEERAPENNYQRKFNEIILAQELNDRLSKEEILALYLNENFYGNLAYGIEAASEVYFNTHAKDLSLSQAALLAGLPQSPTVYNPINYLVRDERGGYLPGVVLEGNWWESDYQLPEGLSPPKIRQIAVLSQMVDEKYITEEQGRAAIATDLRFAPQEVPLNAPHFVFYVRNLLEEKYGRQLLYGGGLRITTTLDLEMQRMVQRISASRIAELEHRNIHNAAVVVMQPNTGQILAMSGSIDFNATVPSKTPGQSGNVLDGQVNVAISERQPGSSLKPFIYLAAMERGLTPASILWDVPTEFPIGNGEYYAPLNYNGKWNGPVRIRTALANSLNMPAVKALKFAGIEHTLELLERVGIKTGLKRGADFYGLALSLGGGEVTPLELTTAYNTLASGGRYYAPNPILKIVDGEGNVIEEAVPGPGEQVISPELTAIISDMMSDDDARAPIWGRNSKLKLSRPAAVKTGTTNDWRDAWTVGFTPYVTVGVWSGNNNNEQTAKVESIEGGGDIWHDVMEEIFATPRYEWLLAQQFPDLRLPINFTLPETGVITETICELPGPFGNYNKELFTTEMLSKTLQATRTAEAATRSPVDDPTATASRRGTTSNRLGCDAYRQVRVVRLPYANSQVEGILTSTDPISSTVSSGQAAYCLPVEGETYPEELVTSLRIWNIPPPDPSERVRYVWNGGSATQFAGDGENPGQYANLRSCRPEDFIKPTPVPPVAGAIQMPDLRHFGENQAKDELAKLGIFSVYVDYQTRDRIPETFDQFAPYAVVSTLPAPGDWYIPGTTVVLGVRSPSDAPQAATPTPQPENAPPEMAPPPENAPPPETAPPPPEQVPITAQPTPTPNALPGPGIQPGLGGN